MANIFLTHPPEALATFYRKKALAALKALGTVRTRTETRELTTAELIEISNDCEIFVSFRQTPGEAALFDNAPNLVAFLRCAIDIRNIDVEAASKNGILVTQAKPHFTAATAETALALMLDIARHITECAIQHRAGREPQIGMGRQLAGSTLGVVGYGRIARHLCHIALAMGMKVMVHDPYVNVERKDIQQVDFETVLRQGDFVLPLAAATEETENLFDETAFSLMKSSAFFINVSRGNLVDEEALENALDKKQIAGAAMDVGRGADQKPSLHLAKRTDVIATPHLGGATPESALGQAMDSVEQVTAIVQGKIPEGAVNADRATRMTRFQGHG
jgi:D-3-phosphoglycerate dehydrogenase / 2-oxoglutarate reductase